MALHLSETHGSDMDAACTNDAVHPYCVWGAGHCSMAPSRRQMFSWPNWSAKKTTAGDLGPGEVAASHSDCGRFQDASINQDSNIFTQVAKLCSCPVGKHLCWVICGDVSTEQFGHGCLFDASTHCFDNFWDAFIDLAKDLIPLKRVILEEVSTLPECIASFAARFGLQALLGFNDGTSYHSPFLHPFFHESYDNDAPSAAPGNPPGAAEGASLS